MGWPYFVLFTVFISACVFSVLKVLTGVLCQSAMESSQSDKDLMTMELPHSQGLQTDSANVAGWLSGRRKWAAVSLAARYTLADLSQLLEDMADDCCSAHMGDYATGLPRLWNRAADFLAGWATRLRRLGYWVAARTMPAEWGRISR